MQTSTPNLVVIISDQHNAGVMGCAGDGAVRTPNLDRLAREGILFDRAYCPNPLCVPSRTGFLTGQHPGDAQVWSNHGSLGSSVPTFAHGLGAAGYEAVLCGRMHFYDPDQFHGFERRLVGDCGSWLSPEILGSGRHRTTGQTGYAVEISGAGRTGYEAFDDQVTREAMTFIDARGERDRPYGLVVGYILPHNPLICSRALFDYYMDTVPEIPIPSGAELQRMNPALRAWITRRGADRLTREQVRRARAAYYGLVTTMDRNVGRILDAVRRSPGGRNTVVIYCSDHGDQAGVHGLWWKSTFFEGSVRVPLIASWPGTIASGTRADAVVNLIDMAPTLLDLAGAEPLPGIEGRSLAPILRTGRTPAGWRNETFSQFSGAHGDRPSAMWLDWPWKLMVYPEFQTCLLFNLEDDPGEERDRAEDPDCASIREGLLARVRSRWSPEQAETCCARERDYRKIVRACGHPFVPHECPRPEVPDGANEFDFERV